MAISPTRARKLSSYLARAAPNRFAGKLRNPFIIIGCGRSGTTLLVDTLAAHKEIAAYPDEANELWHPQTFPWRYSEHQDHLPPIEVDPAEYTRLSLKYRTPSQEQRLRAVFGAYQFVMGKDCFLNKSAMITFMIPYILNQFPDAKFIHVVRDGRGVALSWAKKVHTTIAENFASYENQRFGISFDDLLGNCANSWKLHIEEIETQKKTLDLERKGILFEFRYEDFCLAPNKYLAQIADFMGISSAFFADLDYSHITSRNFKYEEELPEAKKLELFQIMEPALREKGYV